MRVFSLCFVGWIAITTFAWAQKEGEEQPVQNTATINYTIGDLEKMDKLQLTQIYIAKLKRLNTILVYLPFAKLEPQGPNDLKIPSNSANEKAMQSIKSSLNSYNKTLEGSLNGLVPYADKRYIIESILFFQNIINKIELIGLGVAQLGY